MNHQGHGREAPDGGPEDPDCPCRRGPEQVACAAKGCGFCRSAETKSLRLNDIRVVAEAALSIADETKAPEVVRNAAKRVLARGGWDALEAINEKAANAVTYTVDGITVRVVNSADLNAIERILEKERNTAANYKDLWEQSCQAVAELCRKAGASPDMPPDLWTLSGCIRRLVSVETVKALRATSEPGQTESSFEEVLRRACEEPTLALALSWVATWENERAVAQALKGVRDPNTGQLWDTVFCWAFEQVLMRYPRST